jgi:hypothetical protein
MKEIKHYLDNSQKKALTLMDRWLVENLSNDALGGEDLVTDLRQSVLSIAEKGYYNSAQQELLNELRSQYVESTTK